jgi:hypothetical protein
MEVVKMKLIRLGALILIVFVSVGFTACGGKKTKPDVKTETISTTLGQELEDLHKAYKDGIITQKEYEKAKQALIDKRTE